MNPDKSTERPQPSLRIAGFEIYEGLIDATGQRALVEDLRAVVAAAPLIAPVTRAGGR